MTCCNRTNRCGDCGDPCCSQCEVRCYECQRTFCEACLLNSSIEGMPVVLCLRCWRKERGRT